MQDKLLVSLAMSALILFCGIVIFYVAEPDLIIITSMVLMLAINDFWISVFRPTRRTAPPGAKSEMDAKKDKS